MPCRLHGLPLFLKSYTTLPLQPDSLDENMDDGIDFVFRNTAFTYDNALATLSFLPDLGPAAQEDSLQRAKLIGDAIVYASQDDRAFTDGQLRSAYAAGDISMQPRWRPNGLSGTVPIPGFYDEATQMFYKAEQERLDVGNNAWALIALLALHCETGEQSYLGTARGIGEFMPSLRKDDHSAAMAISVSHGVEI